ncbi:hypothetical protein C5167_034576 [Papaver somniferum]|uniref:Cytochrome P450 n=2 Tax=Papaver somniferum TaxID=3469 RepID=A0A4Y7KD93_PAPSO|nr:hypothetical protein C5167_034576 [Papaver somniferum]
MIAGAMTTDIFLWMGRIHRFDGVNAKLEDNFQQLESIIDEHLEPHRPRPEFEDFVDILLRLQKDLGQSISFGRDQIKGILTDIFIAGTDASSSTIVWAMTTWLCPQNVVFVSWIKVTVAWKKMAGE